MTLKYDIAQWDGKSSVDIRGIYDHHANKTGFLADVVRHAQFEPLQKGATWLIKQFIEDAEILDQRQTQAVLSLIPDLVGWEAKLHILQCLPHFSFPTNYRKPVESFTRACILDPNKFVRAWGYSGFYELARQFPTLRSEAECLMEIALRDEPASVKARIRNLIAKGY